MKSWIKAIRNLFQYSIWPIASICIFLSVQTIVAVETTADKTGPGGGQLQGATFESHSLTAGETPEAWKEENPAQTSPLLNNDSLWTSARALGATILILGLILAGALLLKHYLPHRFGSIGGKRIIQILETMPLGEKRSLTLLKIGEEHLLLASTATQITLLKKVCLSAAGNEDDATQKREKKSFINQNANAARIDATSGVSEQPSFRELMKSELGDAPDLWANSPEKVLSRLSRLRKKLQGR